MGKMINMISIIVFVDLLFIIFWGGSTSLNSIIVSWVTNPTDFDGNLVVVALEALGITIAAGALAAVVVALSGAKTDTVLFAAFAFAILINLGKDYLFMFQQVQVINGFLAQIFIWPFVIMFAFVVVEWLKGRD